MKKTIFISIQIDEVEAADLAVIEDLVEKALEEYKRKQISYNLQKSLGQLLPIEQQ